MLPQFLYSDDIYTEVPVRQGAFLVAYFNAKDKENGDKTLFVCDAEDNKWNSCGRADGGGLKHLKDGLKDGALRGVNTIEESEDSEGYQVGENSIVIGENSMCSGDFSLVAGKDNISQAKGSLVVGELNRSNAQFGNMFGSNNTSYDEYNFVTGVDNVTHSRFDAIFGASNVLYQAYPYADTWETVNPNGYNNVFGIRNSIDGTRFTQIFGVSNSTAITGRAQFLRIFGADNNITGSGGDIVDVIGHDNDFGEGGVVGYLYIRGTKNVAENSVGQFIYFDGAGNTIARGIGGYEFIRGAANSITDGCGQFIYLDGADNTVKEGAGGYEYLRGAKNVVESGCGQFIYFDGVLLGARNSSYSQIRGTDGKLYNTNQVYAVGCCLGMNAIYNSSKYQVEYITDYTPSSLSYSFFEGDKIIVDNGGHNVYARGCDIMFTRTLMDGTVTSSSPTYTFVQGDYIRIHGSTHNIYAQGLNLRIENSAYAHIFGSGHTVQNVGSSIAVFGLSNIVKKLGSYGSFTPDGTIFYGLCNNFESIIPTASLLGGYGNTYMTSSSSVNSYITEIIANTSQSTFKDCSIKTSIISGAGLTFDGSSVTNSYVNGDQAEYKGGIDNSIISLKPGGYNIKGRKTGGSMVSSAVIGDGLDISGDISFSYISGSQGKFSKAINYSAIYGHGIVVNTNAIYNSFVSAITANIKSSNYSLIMGSDLETGSVAGSIVIGYQYSNSANSIYNSISIGYGNTGSCNYSFILGTNNIYSSQYNYILGDQNTNNGLKAFIHGDQNTNNATHGVIFGYKNSITANTSDSLDKSYFINGVWNSITKSPNSVVFGTNNIVNGNSSNYIFGHRNSSINGNMNLIIGNGFHVTNSNNSIIHGSLQYGYVSEFHLSNSILSGSCNKVANIDINNSFITGSNNTATNTNFSINNSLIFGVNNTFGHTISNTIIGGYGNIYETLQNTPEVILGNAISIAGNTRYNAIFGNNQSFASGSSSWPITLDSNIIAGENIANLGHRLSDAYQNIKYNAIFGSTIRLGEAIYNIIAGNGHNIDKAYASGIIGNSNYYKTLSTIVGSDGSWVEGNVNHVEDSYCNHVEGEGNYVNNSQLTHNEGIGSMKVTVSEYVSNEPETESSEEPVYKYFIEGTIDGYTYLDFHKLFGVGAHIVNTEHTPSYSLFDQIIGVEQKMIGSALKYVYTLSGPIEEGTNYVSGMTRAVASHIEGGGNNIYLSRHVHIEGIGNISYQAEFSHIEGSGNTDYGKYSHIGGYLNYIGATQGEVNFIHGKDVNYNNEYGSYGTFIGSKGVYSECQFPTVIGSEDVVIEGGINKVAVIASDNINIDETNKKNIVILGMSDVPKSKTLKSNTVYVDDIVVESLTNAAIDALFA